MLIGGVFLFLQTLQSSSDQLNTEFTVAKQIFISCGGQLRQIYSWTLSQVSVISVVCPGYVCIVDQTNEAVQLFRHIHLTFWSLVWLELGWKLTWFILFSLECIAKYLQQFKQSICIYTTVCKYIVICCYMMMDICYLLCSNLH